MNARTRIGTRGRTRRRTRDDRGQVSMLIVGFAVVLMLLVAVVIDASAAFLRHQSLDSLADGAALAGADAGAAGTEVYTQGIGSGSLAQSGAAARAGVRAYLEQVGAFREYPGLTYTVSIVGDSVRVRLSGPLDLPLSFPGSPDHPSIGATSSARVDPDR